MCLLLSQGRLCGEIVLVRTQIDITMGYLKSVLFCVLRVIVHVDECKECFVE